VIDERFLHHRLKSSSLAAFVGAAAIGGWSLYLIYGRHEIRWDLLAILGLMAGVKVGAMIYFRLAD
jgi:hypothetical protein